PRFEGEARAHRPRQQLRQSGEGQSRQQPATLESQRPVSRSFKRPSPQLKTLPTMITLSRFSAAALAALSGFSLAVSVTAADAPSAKPALGLNASPALQPARLGSAKVGPDGF